MLNILIIRPPKKNDLSKLLNFINELTDEDAMIASATRKTLEDEKLWLEETLEDIDRKRKVYLLAFDKNDNLLGIVHVQKERGRRNHIGQLGISVVKKSRGKGIGKKLMNEIFKLAKKELEIDQVVLTCFSINKPALGLYTSLGFKQYGLLPGAYEYKGKRIDQVSMYRNLTD